MTDILSIDARSELMGRIRSKDTRPELQIRRTLHGLGYRFRTHIKNLPGTPDIVFTKRRAIVFVHGCFWHRHGCAKTYTPKSRHEFWADKFCKNVERDKRDRELLEEAGWHVFVAWECQIESDETLIERLIDFLGAPSVGDDLSIRRR